MRPAAVFGSIALATALGATVLGQLVVIPGLEHQTDLIDPNLAKALTASLHIRLAEITLAASLILLALVPRWLDSRWATTQSLVLVAAATLSRVVVVPNLYLAWSHADLVAGRPLARVAQAQQWSLYDQGLALIATVALLGLIGVAAQTSGSPSTTPKPTWRSGAAKPAMSSS